ncbi:MAG: squalene synthase HpnC [Betaproteobacteria bacterium]|nr:squalene synthase HpnC [Betaproteobacteria bacterium]
MSADPSAAARPWHGVDHYENFPVASWLVPARQRPAVAALYRFARHADDVADEGDAPAALRLAELDRLEAALVDASVPHPAVEPLRALFATDPQAALECRALLSAFRQDVSVHRHPDQAAIADYCARSAAPVGRLMLGLFGCRHASLLARSDAICVALQLINFLQDIAADWTRGRLYLPLDELAAAGLDERALDRALAQGACEPALRTLLERRTRQAAALLESGASLAGAVPWRLGLELRGVLAGGRRIVEQLARTGYDPVAQRPRLGAADTGALLRLALRPPRL